MNNLRRRKQIVVQVAAALAALSMASAPTYAARLFENSPDWDVHLDTSIQYTLGARADDRAAGIAGHPFFAEGDYKFGQGDIVTSRINAIVGLTAVYQKNMGFRISGSGWDDFAYSDKVKTNPTFPGLFLTYPDGKYSPTTKKYTIRGAELLDAFVFYNTSIGDKPLYLKAGRFTQFWGNSFFFGFEN